MCPFLWLFIHKIITVHIHAYVKLVRSKQTRVRIEQSEKVKEPWQESEDPHEPIASEDRPLKKGERWTTHVIVGWRMGNGCDGLWSCVILHVQMLYIEQGGKEVECHQGSYGCRREILQSAIICSALYNSQKKEECVHSAITEPGRLPS